METNENISWYVIDTSICGYSMIDQKINDIIKANGKIIITSVVVAELEKLQHSNRNDASAASHLLAIAAENENTFIPVKIDEPYTIADDNIIEYCTNCDRKVILLTSDKTMALKARMQSINTEYLKRTAPNTSDNASKVMLPSTSQIQPNGKVNDKKSSLVTLSPTTTKGNNLYIVSSKKNKQAIRVYSNGLEFNGEDVKLHVGDDVFIVTKKMGYLSFAHYRLCSISKKQNSLLLYNKRIYSKADLNNLNSYYKSFIRDCMIRFDL